MPEVKILTGYPSIDKPWLKYYSEEAINAPLPQMTMYEYVWENNKSRLDSIAIEYFGNRITYQSLFDSIEKAAKAFVAAGIQTGDVVVIASVTLPEIIYAIYALTRSAPLRIWSIREPVQRAFGTIFRKSRRAWY